MLGAQLVASVVAFIAPLAEVSPPVADNWFNDFIGPYIKTADGRTVAAGAEYWCGVVGVAFDRDIDLDIPPTPLDLDLDREPDTVFSGHWTLKGGLLANPEQVGLIPTPDDPKGTVGKYSVSTGFLGVREELDPVARRGTGRYAFNCMVCHGGADISGRILIGRPNVNIHLGLIMASSRVMDPSQIIRWPGNGRAVTPEELRQREGLDGSFILDADGDQQVSIAEWRNAMKLPTAQETRALLMLAGPGRLDQSVDPRMDGTIPLANLQQYWRQKQGSEQFLRMQRRVKRTVFNPVSLPPASCGIGVAHYSWTGKDSSWLHDASSVIFERMHVPAPRVLELMRWPGQPTDDHERLNRGLTLDFRNVGTYARETDATYADGWMMAMLSSPSERLMLEAPAAFGASGLRDLLTRELPERGDANDPQIALGRQIFCERETGEIINQRILQGREAPTPAGAHAVTALAPIDRSRPMTDRIPVRCATCHNYSPTSALRPITTPLNAMQRCDICHMDHPVKDAAGQFIALREHMRREKLETVDDCNGCHKEHPDFGPQVYSNSWLLPFDANGNGRTFGDEAADAAAGGIGTDAYLAIDSLFSIQMAAPELRGREKLLVVDNPRATPKETRYTDSGFGWVRVAPLISLRDTAPYLHNGAVPTLNDLFSADSARPRKFAIGSPAQRFTYDATLKGNLNCGHEFGMALNNDERQALVRFLESLP